MQYSSYHGDVLWWSTLTCATASLCPSRFSFTIISVYSVTLLYNSPSSVCLHSTIHISDLSSFPRSLVLLRKILWPTFCRFQVSGQLKLQNCRLCSVCTFKTWEVYYLKHHTVFCKAAQIFLRFLHVLLRTALTSFASYNISYINYYKFQTIIIIFSKLISYKKMCADALKTKYIKFKSCI